MLKRRYVTVGGERQVHYRHGGEGPVVVLLHESPLSSQSLVPMAEALAERFTVIALDTPGYGLSDPLVGPEAPEIADYAASLAETLSALGVSRCGIYGRLTGSFIALALASSRPDLVSAAVLDAMPIYTENEQTWFLENYLPTFPPRFDGTHFVVLWHRFRDQHAYYPWCDPSGETRLAIDMPKARDLHEGTLDLIRAGDGYRVGYAAAFRCQPDEALRALEVPTTLILREHDMAAGQADRLSDLPEAVEKIRLGGDDAALVETIVGQLGPHLDAGAKVELPAWEPIPGKLTATYADTSVGQLHVLGRAGSDARPMAVFHSSPTSARVLSGLVEELMQTRPVLAFDTLGNGESDKPPGWEIAPSWEPNGLDELSGTVSPEEPWIEPTIADYAGVVVEALDALEVDEIDLYGTLTGGLLAVEVAIALGPDRAGSVIVDGLPWFTPEQEQQLLDTYTPPLEPRWDGSHLLFAWSFLRAAFEWWPWYVQTAEGAIPGLAPSTEFLNVWVAEFIKSGHTYPLAYRAAFRYHVEERLPLLESPLLVVGPEGDQMTPLSEPGAALAQNGVFRTKPPAPSDQVALYGRFVAGAAV